MRDIVIVGAGGLGREVLFLIETINFKKEKWNILGFLDDHIEMGTIYNGSMVLGSVDWLRDKNVDVIIAIADSNIKRSIVEKLKYNSEIKFPQVIHPNVEISNTTTVGEGTIIFNNSTITTNVNIGKHVLINYNSTVGHDSVILDYTSIMPGVSISGNTNIGKEVLMGAKSVVLQGLNIGDRVIVGAGSVVIDNVKDNSIVVGVPAKKIKER